MFEWVTLAKMLVSWKRFHVGNIWWQLMTWNWQDSDMLGHTENMRHLEVMKHPHRKGGFKHRRKFGPVLEDRLRITCLNIELTSELIPWWISILDWCMNKYVDELPLEHGKSVHYGETVTGTERPVATKPKEQSSTIIFILNHCGADRSSERDPYPSVSRRQWPEH